VIPVLVTLAQAQRHLKIEPAADGSPSAADADLQDKVDQATAMVVDYIRRPSNEWEIESWSLVPMGSPAAPAPAAVVWAVLLQIGYLYRYRGDDAADGAPLPDDGYPPQAVCAALKRYRDPVMS